MKYIELQEAFERELNTFYDGINKPKSSDTEWWLNRGVEKFYKTRYSGINFKLKGFEQDQKRIDDLRTLITMTTYTDTIEKVSNTEFKCQLPDDYVLLLGDTAYIAPSDGVINNCWEKDEEQNYIPHFSDTLEVTIDTIDREKQNSLSEYRLKYCQARPLKLIQNNYVLLYTDGKYKVVDYSMIYLRKPSYIDIHTKPFDEYTDMPEHTHMEIVKLAAQMYLENQLEQRYTSHSNEVKEME